MDLKPSITFQSERQLLWCGIFFKVSRVTHSELASLLHCLWHRYPWHPTHMGWVGHPLLESNWRIHGAATTQTNSKRKYHISIAFYKDMKKNNNNKTLIIQSTWSSTPVMIKNHTRCCFTTKPCTCKSEDYKDDSQKICNHDWAGKYHKHKTNALHRHDRPVLQTRNVCHSKYIPEINESYNHVRQWVQMDNNKFLQLTH